LRKSSVKNSYTYVDLYGDYDQNNLPTNFDAFVFFAQELTVKNVYENLNTPSAEMNLTIPLDMDNQATADNFVGFEIGAGKHWIMPMGMHRPLLSFYGSSKINLSTGDIYVAKNVPGDYQTGSNIYDAQYKITRNQQGEVFLNVIKPGGYCYGHIIMDSKGAEFGFNLCGTPSIKDIKQKGLIRVLDNKQNEPWYAVVTYEDLPIQKVEAFFDNQSIAIQQGKGFFSVPYQIKLSAAQMAQAEEKLRFKVSYQNGYTFYQTNNLIKENQMGMYFFTASYYGTPIKYFVKIIQ
jgi:hypothetical protein